MVERSTIFAFQSIINSQLYGMRIDEAVAAPRIHHQLLPASLKVESNLPKVSLLTLTVLVTTIDALRHFETR